LGHPVEGRAVGNLPAGELDIVAVARAQLESVMVLVHPEIGRGAVVAGNDLHAEDVRGQVLPRLRVAGPDAHVSELGNTGHDRLLRGCAALCCAAGAFGFYAMRLREDSPRIAAQLPPAGREWSPAAQ
jgi:hypothetical protein